MKNTAEKLFLVLVSFFILTGCQTLNKYTDAKSQTDLSRFEGKNILIRGRVSNVPWQHLIGNFKDYPVALYFDIGKDFDKYQTVIYLRKTHSGVLTEVPGLIFG